MRRLIALPAVCATLASATRNITTESFVSSVDQIQQQLQTAQDRRTELLRYGRQLYEVEHLDDLATAYTAPMASKVCHLASQLRIDATKGQPFAAVIEASISEAGEKAMDVPSLARIIHSCLVLRSAYLYDVLFTFIPFVRANAATMDAVSTAVLLNAYGRSGVHHPGLYKAMSDNAAVVLKDTRVSLAHIANVAYAVSRVRYLHAPLMLTLRDHAVRKVSEASPIISLTLLDSFTELHQIDEELFAAYEQRLLDHVGELPAPLLASFISCIVRAGRGRAERMEALGARATALADTFDAASIAKVADAYFQAGVLSEDVFGALAERACKVAPDFRTDEMAAVLNALSAFDLFDGELFPMLASRLSSMYRQADYVDAADAAVVLSSFAAVQERNDELVYACSQIFAAYPDVAMSGATRINALWAFASLNIHNEAQTKMLEETRAKPALLRLTADGRLSAKSRAVLEERRQFLGKMFGIDVSACSA